MTHRRLAARALAAAVLSAVAWGSTGAASPTKLLRFPDIHGDDVVFCYAGDIWKVSARGGLATRLTAHPGVEVFPRFSPDGRWIAFTGQYDGDEQVYVMPTTGGEPTQLTFYPADGPLPARWGYDNIVYGWTPDGRSILFRSLRYGYPEHDGQLYIVDREGGPAVPLPMPRAGAADFAPDGKRLAYSPLWRDFRTWKRYQGGWAQDLYIYDLATHGVKPVAPSPRTERDPMWVGDAIYFVSDRTGTLNLFRYDTRTEQATQITRSDTWDVRWASSDGTGRIVYELGGEIVVLDAASQRSVTAQVTVPDDGLWDRPSRVPVAGNIEDFALSPKGERALFAARGDVFTAPIENGPTRNLTRSSGAHDRAPAWSPDGKSVAFISDRSGEEDIWIAPQDGAEAPKPLTRGHRARLYRPAWSPDGARIAFADKDGKIFVVSVADGREIEIADERNFQVTDYAWSACGGWLAFSLTEPNGNRAIHVWGVSDGKTRRVTDGLANAFDPSWDPDGKLLWYLSDRDYAPQFSSIEWNFATNRMTGVLAVALRADVPHPFAPLSDEVKPDDATKEDDKKAEKDETSPKKVGPAKEFITIDFDGLDRRVARAPIDADNLDGLTLVKGHLLYAKSSAPFYGRDPEAKTQLRIYDLEKRKETTLVDGIGGFAVSRDGKKVLVVQDGVYALYDATPAGKDSKKVVATSGLVVDRVPREEWRNAFHEVWRRYRDFFYVENMHGYDWEALRKRYEPLLEHVGHRSDLNYLIGEMIAELNVGHAYIEGGDWTIPSRAPVGLLGAKLELDRAAGRYRIAKIFQGQNEEPRYRSPMTEIGVDVKEGDWLLAIDGNPLRPDQDPFRLLVNRASNPVTLTVSSKRDASEPRQVKINPTRDESALLYLDWTERNRRWVDEASGGRVGYMHIPNMGADGAREFIKWFYPQARKNGLVVDDRANGGGNISSWIIERLRREVLGVRYIRTADDPRTYPDRVMRGPMACLISETSASDGDIFPHMFRLSGLGPLIGKRTWGGVVGITGHGPLIDGGQVFVPQFGSMGPDGAHVMEGIGVPPDIEVENDPASEIAGRDLQLERALEEILAELAKDPHEFPPRPADPVKTK